MAHHHPGVLGLDVNLPALSGVEGTRRLREQQTTTAILALTVHADSQTVFGLLESGAIGYVLKDEALETLANAVRAAACGTSWLSPAIARQVVSRVVEQSASPPSPSSPPSILTPCEQKVLRLLAQGLYNASIARQLVVTKRTVQNHVSSIYGKLGVASRAEAILYAIRHRLAQVEDLEDDRDE